MLSPVLQFTIRNLDEVVKPARINTHWSLIGKVKLLMKFESIVLSRIMLGILTILHSNAECESIFSVVAKIRTKF
ncbi:hypothetical protein X975_09669, partial [Stegodyphus mimosarum]